MAKWILLAMALILCPVGSQAQAMVKVFNPALPAMGEAIQDEYRAYFTYLRVLKDFGEVYPFANIVHAEKRHIKEIAALYEARGVSVPKSRWNQNNVPTYLTVKGACAAAVGAERENVAMYDRLLTRELTSDVRQVFLYLRAASLNNHLPAFERCVKRRS